MLTICPLESIANDQIHEACSSELSAGLLREANKDDSGNYPQLLFSSAEEIEECKGKLKEFPFQLLAVGESHTIETWTGGRYSTLN